MQYFKIYHFSITINNELQFHHFQISSPPMMSLKFLLLISILSYPLAEAQAHPKDASNDKEEAALYVGSELEFCLLTIRVRHSWHKICVINDPLGPTHSPTSSDHYFHTTFVSFCDILKSGSGRTDGRTEICAKIMITTGRDCGSAEWNYKTEPVVNNRLDQPTHDRQWWSVLFRSIMTSGDGRTCEYRDHCRPCAGRPRWSMLADILWPRGNFVVLCGSSKYFVVPRLKSLNSTKETKLMKLSKLFAKTVSHWKSREFRVIQVKHQPESRSLHLTWLNR